MMMMMMMMPMMMMMMMMVTCRPVWKAMTVGWDYRAGTRWTPPRSAPIPFLHSSKTSFPATYVGREPLILLRGAPPRLIHKE